MIVSQTNSSKIHLPRAGLSKTNSCNSCEPTAVVNPQNKKKCCSLLTLSRCGRRLHSPSWVADFWRACARVCRARPKVERRTRSRGGNRTLLFFHLLLLLEDCRCFCRLLVVVAQREGLAVFAQMLCVYARSSIRQG